MLLDQLVLEQQRLLHAAREHDLDVVRALGRLEAHHLEKIALDVVYEDKDLIVIVVKVGHRREVYR